MPRDAAPLGEAEVVDDQRRTRSPALDVGAYFDKRRDELISFSVGFAVGVVWVGEEP